MTSLTKWLLHVKCLAGRTVSIQAVLTHVHLSPSCWSQGCWGGLGGSERSLSLGKWPVLQQCAVVESSLAP